MLIPPKMYNKNIWSFKANLPEIFLFQLTSKVESLILNGDSRILISNYYKNMYDQLNPLSLIY